MSEDNIQNEIESLDQVTIPSSNEEFYSKL